MYFEDESTEKGVMRKFFFLFLYIFKYCTWVRGERGLVAAEKYSKAISLLDITAGRRARVVVSNCPISGALETPPRKNLLRVYEQDGGNFIDIQSRMLLLASDHSIARWMRSSIPFASTVSICSAPYANA